MDGRLVIQVGVKTKTKFGDNFLHSTYFVISTTFLDSLSLQTYKQTLCLEIVDQK